MCVTTWSPVDAVGMQRRRMMWSRGSAKTHGYVLDRVVTAVVIATATASKHITRYRESISPYSYRCVTYRTNSLSLLKRRVASVRLWAGLDGLTVPCQVRDQLRK
ncbi:unnamed protein product [Ixodes pacificus]